MQQIPNKCENMHSYPSINLTPLCWGGLGTPSLIFFGLWDRSRSFWTRAKFKIIQTDSIVFKNMFDLMGFAYVLRARDSFYFLDFQNFQDSTIFPRFHHFQRFHHLKIPFLQKKWEKPIDLDPRKIKTIHRKVNSFQEVSLIN